MKATACKGFVRSLFFVSGLSVLTGLVSAQTMRLDGAASERPGAHLNRIFSSTSSYGPLGQNRRIDVSEQLLLFWSEPPPPLSTGMYNAYHYQIMSYDSASRQLSMDGSLSGDSVTDAVDDPTRPAIGGNKQSLVLADDMVGDGYAEAVSVWETAGQKLFASAQQVNKTDLTFTSSTVTGELVGDLTSTISDSSGEIKACLSDLMGDGQKDLVITWVDPADSKVHIAIHGWSQSAASHLALISSISDMPVTETSGYMSLIALATGDFRQDGRNEIALAGFCDASHVYIKLYYLDSGENIVAAGESVLPSDVTATTKGFYGLQVPA